MEELDPRLRDDTSEDSDDKTVRFQDAGETQPTKNTEKMFLKLSRVNMSACDQTQELTHSVPFTQGSSRGFTNPTVPKLMVKTVRRAHRMSSLDTQNPQIKTQVPNKTMSQPFVQMRNTNYGIVTQGFEPDEHSEFKMANRRNSQPEISIQSSFMPNNSLGLTKFS